MSKWVCSNNPSTILDPGVGHCALLAPCHQACPDAELIGYDIDDSIRRYVDDNIDYDMDLRMCDYLDSWGGEYDGIICNPPYNKFQTIKNRDLLIERFESKMKIRLSGYTNILGYFLVKCVFELKKGGRSSFIIPYEFLNTGYGTVIKRYLLDEKVLVSIIKFDNSNNVFDDAITTTCILLLEKKENTEASFIEVDDVDDLHKIDFDAMGEHGPVRGYDRLDPSRKWLDYFDSSEKEDLCGNENLVKISGIGKVMRGIATGDNDYFTMNRSKIETYGISEECLMPCICKSSDVSSIIFTKEDFENLVSCDRKTYLFNGCNAVTDSDFAYIHHGESIGSSERHLTSHRSPWYSIENKKIAPILITVFNRDGIKVVKNESGARNLTSFHGFHPSKEYDNETDISTIFCCLCSEVVKKLLFRNKREYGDKLDKYEPNDLNESYIIDPHRISDNDKNAMKEFCDAYRRNRDRERFVESIDSLLAKYLEPPSPDVRMDEPSAPDGAMAAGA